MIKTGTSGDDRLKSYSGVDTLIMAAGGGTDTVYAKVSYTLAAGEEIEYVRDFAGATGLTLTGNEFDNHLMGATGNDTFVFDAPFGGNSNGDVIADFVSGADTIEIDHTYYFNGLTVTGSRPVRRRNRDGCRSVDRLQSDGRRAVLRQQWSGGRRRVPVRSSHGPSDAGGIRHPDRLTFPGE